MRDMNPRGDRSIRNIPVPANHRHIRLEEPPKTLGDTYEEDFTETPASPKQKKMKRRRQNRFLWTAAGVVALCAIVGVLLSTVFSGATVTVSARTAVVTPPSTIVAQPNAPAGSLSYQVISTSRSASTTVAANGTQHVSRAATGVITIYNAYSSASQRLIVNTRFEAPDGKIYRIHDSVVVPGSTKDASGAVVPGEVTVSAFADSPGDSYNKGPTQLTIPGFKGDPRYDKFYAKTPEFTGGFVGEEVAVAPGDLQKAQDLLKQSLGDALRSGAQSQIPKEFSIIPGTLAISYGNTTQTPADGGKATISQSASATANIVRMSDLASAIAKQTVQGYNGEPIDFVDSTQLSIAVDASTTTPTGPLQLRLSGSPTLLWQFDANALKQALLGKTKDNFETIVQLFAPAIQCTTETPCKASVRPFWSSSFPTNPDKITIDSGQD